MLSTNFGSDNTHLFTSADQYEHQLVCVEVALFAVPIEERFCVVKHCHFTVRSGGSVQDCHAGSLGLSQLHDNV